MCRIQQIQLLARDLNPNEHDRLWNQLESEIHLHRHKAVIRACRGRIGPGFQQETPSFPGTQGQTSLRRHQCIGDVRKVCLTKGKDEGLGISITASILSLHASLSPLEAALQLFPPPPALAPFLYQMLA